MSSRPQKEAAYFASRTTVVSQDETWHIGRDTDGDYYIEMADATIYIGNANVANRVHQAIGSLLDANDEVD